MSASPPKKPEFVWITCQPGMEASLKEEIAREFGEDKLRAAFQRPGWVTWKVVDEKTPGAWPAVWQPRTPLAARGWGVSLEPLKVEPSGGTLAAQLDAAFTRAGASPATHVLQAWVRPEHAPGEEPPEWLAAARAWKAGLEHELVSGGWQVAERAPEGSRVIDIVRVDENSVLLGAHEASRGRSPWPGGQYPSELPDGAPSRAALKLEEVLDWSGFAPAAGERALEIGAAPGGACHVLLSRGLQVVGVDPGKMDERILKQAKFRHVPRTFTELAREDLRGEPVHWLMVDLNGPGEVAIDAVEKVLPWIQDTLKGAVLTLKIGDLRRLAGVGPWTQRLEVLGFKGVRLAQLSHHRQELGAVALWSPRKP